MGPTSTCDYSAASRQTGAINLTMDNNWWLTTELEVSRMKKHVSRVRQGNYEKVLNFKD